MKEYLTNVPVKINIWIRPKCQKLQFDVIKQARPNILFIVSDGGRTKEEQEIILSNRKLIEEGIDWNCEVHKIYEDNNNGIYTMERKAGKYIWNRVDRCVFLEDDQIPSVSYFRYCAELLEKYKDDTRVCMICGMNHLDVYKDVPSDYFFSSAGSIWGCALWKRTVEKFNFRNIHDPYYYNLLKNITKNNKIFWKQFNGYLQHSIFDGHKAGGEFWLSFIANTENQYLIVPKYNLISNIGYEETGLHAHGLHKMPASIRKVFNLPTHELSFPLKHPSFFIPDNIYEQKVKKIMGWTFTTKILRIFETIILRVRYFDFSFLKKYYQKIIRIEIEK